MILQLSEVLEVRLRTRNLWLTGGAASPRCIGMRDARRSADGASDGRGADDAGGASTIRRWRWTGAERADRQPAVRGADCAAGGDVWERVGLRAGAGRDAQHHAAVLPSAQGIRSLVTNWAAVGPAAVAARDARGA